MKQLNEACWAILEEVMCQHVAMFRILFFTFSISVHYSTHSNTRLWHLKLIKSYKSASWLLQSVWHFMIFYGRTIELTFNGSLLREKKNPQYISSLSSFFTDIYLVICFVSGFSRFRETNIVFLSWAIFVIYCCVLRFLSYKKTCHLIMDSDPKIDPWLS